MWRSQKRSVQLRLGYGRFDRVEDNKAPLREGAGCAVAVVLSFRKVKKPRSLERDVSKRQVYQLMSDAGLQLAVATKINPDSTDPLVACAGA